MANIITLLIKDTDQQEVKVPEKKGWGSYGLANLISLSAFRLKNKGYWPIFKTKPKGRIFRIKLWWPKPKSEQ